MYARINEENGGRQITVCSRPEREYALNESASNTIQVHLISDSSSEPVYFLIKYEGKNLDAGYSVWLQIGRVDVCFPLDPMQFDRSVDSSTHRG